MKEIVITSSVLIAALLVLRLVFAKKVSRTLIYGAWALVALRLLVPVQIGQLDFSVLTATQEVTQTVEQLSARPVSGQTQQEVYKDIVLDYLEKDQTAFSPQVQEQIRQETAQGGATKEEIADRIQQKYPQQEIFVSEVQQQVQQQVAQTAAAPTLGQVATAVWLSGVAAMAVWFAFLNLRHSRSLRSHAQRLDCDSPIPVYLAENAASPCLVGLFRPAVYLTPICGEDEEIRRHVLAHELTHYRHGDYIWAVVRCVCLCVHWFNPLVWAAAFASRRDCELACDEGALKRLGEAERIPYGKTLLAVVSHAATPAGLLQTATAMAETKKQLKERVNFIVKKYKISRIAVICMVLVCAIVAGCALTGPAGNSGADTLRPYLAATTVDGKLAVIYEDTLLLTNYDYIGTPQLTLCMDGSQALCITSEALLHIYQGKVQKVADNVSQYQLSVSGDAVAYTVENENGVGILYHYDATTGKTYQLHETARDVYSFAISPDGKTVASTVNKLLRVYQNGSLVLETEIQSENFRKYQLISIDNSADVIYVYSYNRLWSFNKKGEKTSLGVLNTIYPDAIMEGDFYSNADHTQLLYRGRDGNCLSDRGGEGVLLYSDALRVLNGRITCIRSAYSYEFVMGNTITYNCADLSTQLMMGRDLEAVHYFKHAGGGAYTSIAQRPTTQGGVSWQDPTGRYWYDQDGKGVVTLFDLETGENRQLLENVYSYVVGYDGVTVYYTDELPTYGGSLYRLNAAENSKPEKLTSDFTQQMFTSENSQLFYLVDAGEEMHLYTINRWGKPERLLKDVQTFRQEDCGMIYVVSGQDHYIIQAGELIKLQIKSAE